jgi:A/G-specific adenine glycosylase
MRKQTTAERWTGRIQRKLIRWFAKNQRSFPWRKTSNPFKLLIAEKFLQQTAARSSVIEAYVETIQRYPTPAALAVAPPAALKRIVAPLGFHFRAAELKRLANTIVEKHKGQIPDNLHELRRLPGVGEYSARAVLCFGFGQDLAVVDTNVARFLHRVFGLPDPVGNNPARNRKLIQLAGSLVPKGRARDFNLAVLDLCASICTSSRPNCAICPLRQDCTFAISLSEAPT